VTHPLWGLVILLGVLGLVFWLTYTLAMPVVNWLDKVIIGQLANTVQVLMSGAPAWITSLLINGLIGGVGTVLTFLPILVFFFAALGFLEDVGYMARATYIMDRFMHWMGLHGRSFLLFFLGFGCNVSAVMGARILEERRTRILTILLIPLVPCTGRLVVVAFLAPAFFGSAAVLATWGLVALNVVLLALIGVTVNRLVFHRRHLAFIMEVPLYHLPNARTIGFFVWYNTVAFVKKAGSIILVVSIVVWALAALPNGDVESSYLMQFGSILLPLGHLMGLDDWRLIVSLLTSFVAKENTIAVLGILFGNETGSSLATQVAATLSTAAALAFLVVQMTFIPCVATVAVIKKETGAWRWAALSVGLLLTISLCAGIAFYQVTRLLT